MTDKTFTRSEDIATEQNPAGDVKMVAESETAFLGKYNVTETKVPDGYRLNTETKTVELVYKDQNTPVVEANAEFYNEAKKGDVEITKEDVTTSEGLPDTGIRILDKDKNTVVEGRTDSNGKLSFKDLPDGDYYFQEFDAPKGYQIDETPQAFSIRNAEVTKCVMTNTKAPVTGVSGSMNAGIIIAVICAAAVIVTLVVYNKKKGSKAKNDESHKA